jgi:hypothetical protein
VTSPGNGFVAMVAMVAMVVMVMMVAMVAWRRQVIAR